MIQAPIQSAPTFSSPSLPPTIGIITPANPSAPPTSEIEPHHDEYNPNTSLLSPLPPSSSSYSPAQNITAESLTQGYLRIKKTFGYKNFYFTLNPALATLSYADSKNSKKPKEIIQIGRYFVDPHGSGENPCKFRLCTPTHTRKLKAAGAEQCERWIAALRRACPPADFRLPTMEAHTQELRACHAGKYFPEFAQVTPSSPYSPVAHIIVEKRYAVKGG